MLIYYFFFIFTETLIGFIDFLYCFLFFISLVSTFIFLIFSLIFTLKTFFLNIKSINFPLSNALATTANFYVLCLIFFQFKVPLFSLVIFFFYFWIIYMYISHVQIFGNFPDIFFVGCLFNSVKA